MKKLISFFTKIISNTLLFFAGALTSAGTKLEQNPTKIKVKSRKLEIEGRLEASKDKEVSVIPFERVTTTSKDMRRRKALDDYESTL